MAHLNRIKSFVCCVIIVSFYLLQKETFRAKVLSVSKKWHCCNFVFCINLYGDYRSQFTQQFTGKSSLNNLSAYVDFQLFSLTCKTVILVNGSPPTITHNAIQPLLSTNVTSSVPLLHLAALHSGTQTWLLFYARFFINMTLNTAGQW